MLAPLLALALLSLSAAAARAEACDPQKDRTAIIAMCSSGCSALFCGYNTPHAGTRFRGLFITYNGRSDNAPISVPDGRDEAANVIGVAIGKDAALHFDLDEIPDFSLAVDVARADQSGLHYHFQSNPNESFVLDDLPEGFYTLRIIHNRHAQGGAEANYVPTLYVLPTVKPDSAGDRPEAARDLGALSVTRPTLSVDEFLTDLYKRDTTGKRLQERLVRDRDDWFKVTLAVRGLLTISLKSSFILGQESKFPPELVFRGNPGDFPQPFPVGGVTLEPGVHALGVRTPEIAGIDFDEFGLRYHLDLRFTPK